MNPLIYALAGLVVGGTFAGILFALLRRGRSVDDELVQRLVSLEEGQERQEKTFRDEFSRNRDETGKAAKAQREELSGALQRLNETTVKSITEIGAMLKTPIENVVDQTSKLSESNAQRLEALRLVVDLRLKQLQEDNAQQIDKMRATVDEKLQGTLEKRLGESFKLVSDRLEQVHQGLGAMQQLASDVGGLQKVLTNVKTRGGWGEVQLGSLLEQVLTTDQFAQNVKTRDDTGERVDFAIKLPGDANGAPVWLPIDAKFATEDYQRLVAAQEQGDVNAIDDSMKALETQLRKSAKDICGKYINPPMTTDFGIMFLPTEGLYAEAIRRIGLVEQVQRECRVIFAGPTTLAALLNSLQMGFRTLAIQQRSSEVWNLLAGVKNEFGKFGEALSAVKDKLDQASRHVDKVTVRSRAITKKLQDIEELPSNPQPLLPELLRAESNDEADGSS
ncbi:MAG: DNA recombination protein RmuC [Chthoniobacterales bacterium]